jgi:hypothetical protein
MADAMKAAKDRMGTVMGAGGGASGDRTPNGLVRDRYLNKPAAPNEAVRRNLGRFPADFMFQLNAEERENLRSQFATSRGEVLGNLRSQSVTSSSGHGGRRHPPYAFTEHGVAMLSSVLTSQRAVDLNILIIRAFVRLREYLATHKDLANKLADVERTQNEHGAHIEQTCGYIQQLLEPPPESPKRRIGFATGHEGEE